MTDAGRTTLAGNERDGSAPRVSPLPDLRLDLELAKTAVSSRSDQAAFSRTTKTPAWEEGSMRHPKQRPCEPHGPSLRSLLSEIDRCRVCEGHLPFGPRPVLQVSEKAGLLIISQAPGSKVHHSGIPWNDSSGDRLRYWLGLDARDFYDSAQVALIPIGLCYPGAAESGGDNPPRRECAELWHDRLIAYLPQIQLTLLVGQYAQRRYLGVRCKGTLTKTVAAFSDYRPAAFPLPHPSWRSALWAQKNPWFEREMLPELRSAVRACTRNRADREPSEASSNAAPASLGAR